MPERPVTPSEADRIPGWYGKIPALGDFASRRLSQPFLSAWDVWLQHAMTASRTALADGWLDVYMNSPVWRFVLMPGVIGDTLWGGVIMPSVDKVGRHFPLTIAAAVPDAPGCMAGLLGARDWYGDLEETALETLSVDFQIQQFEANLASMPCPAAANTGSEAALAGLAGWWRTPSGMFEMPIPPGYDMQQLMQRAADQLFQSAAAGKTLWWREADASGPIQLACFNALPPPEQFSVLLKGRVPDVRASIATGAVAASAVELRSTQP